MLFMRAWLSCKAPELIYRLALFLYKKEFNVLNRHIHVYIHTKLVNLKH